MTNFACVIPTLGRVSLKRAVISVLTQCEDVNVIVVVDKKADYGNVEKLLIGLKVQVIYPGFSGVSRLRNFGVTSTDCKWVTFLDDDDVWLPNRIIELQAAIEQNPGIQLLVSRTLQISNGKPRIRPQSLVIGFINPALNWYRPTFFRNSNYMGTSNWALERNSYIENKFDENLKIREDLDFLFRFSGKIKQYSTIDTLTYHDPSRARGRETSEAAFRWARFLWKKSKRAAVNFLIFEFLRTRFISLLHRSWKAKNIDESS